jgi:threonine/homoserine/homoserine lactone efflux protein
VISQLPTNAVAGLSLLGALVIAWFAWENLVAARTANLDDLRSTPATPGRFARVSRQPIVQAALVNLLNPAPWLFWISAGAPLLLSFAEQGWSTATVYLIAFYIAIVGSKAALVAAIAVGRHRLTSRGYRIILLGVALMLIVLAIALAVNGVRTLISAG